MTKQEFLELLNKYLSGTATAEEEKLLNTTYKYYSDNCQLNDNDLNALNEAEGRLFNNIQSAIQPTTKNTLIRKLPAAVKYAAAACVLVIIGFAIKMLLVKPAENELTANNLILSNDFKPGGNKAYLILSSGKAIALNDAQAGVLATQGNHTVIKQRGGQIIYQSDVATQTATQSNLYNKIIVPRGGQYKVTLPDGTAVWLNASSTLQYPVQFSGNYRSVKLTGEAYFEVAKNKQLPFIVNVNNKVNVRVLGTHFDIMGYDAENHITATLLEGSVRIEDYVNAANAAMLVPGQQANVAADKRITVANAEVDDAVAWKEGQFIFNNEGIYSITRKLSRWYDVDFVFDSRVKDISFDGTISRFKNISEVLQLMERTQSVHFKTAGRRILVMP